jgi:hypothetical protein
MALISCPHCNKQGAEQATCERPRAGRRPSLPSGLACMWEQSSSWSKAGVSRHGRPCRRSVMRWAWDAKTFGPARRRNHSEEPAGYPRRATRPMNSHRRRGGGRRRE